MEIIEMKNLAYKGNATSHNGKILTTSVYIKVNERRAAQFGDMVFCPIHGDNKIVEGSSMKNGCVGLSRDGVRTQRSSFLISTFDDATVR
jgi:uncharacterized Zn-binding protein involved in type VI secretion